MPKLDDLLAVLTDEIKLAHTPPVELMTRLHFLVGGDQADILWLDAAVTSDSDPPGTRYTFAVVTGDTFCFLLAEHDDESWSYDRRVQQQKVPTPMRKLDAWRRPLRTCSEVGLAGDVREWLATKQGSAAVAPILTLTFEGHPSIDLPLPNPSPERTQPADPERLLNLIAAAWDT